MDHELRKQMFSSLNLDIDQLCHLIDENTFGLKIVSSSKLPSIPSYQIKAFRSSRLKRLNSSSPSTLKSNSNDNYSLLLNRFHSLSTDHRSHSRRPASTTLCHTKLILPSLNDEEEMNSSIQSQSSCSSVRSQSTVANSCNVEELAAYFDDFLYIPKSLSGAAELMYT